MAHSDWRIDHKAPGFEFWTEGVAEVVDSGTPEEVADSFRVFFGHEIGPGKFRAVKLINGEPLGVK